MAYDGKEFHGPNGVNVAEILRVADLVERSATFDMVRAFHPCGSPACIIGHVLAVDDERNADHAALALGLYPEGAQARTLFMPEGRFHYRSGPGEFGHITNEHAALCLRNLAATGLVDWQATNPARAAQPKAEGV